MRLDIFLSKIGIIKRRTMAKELADSGLIKVNDKKAKPARDIEPSDIIRISGRKAIVIEVLKLPKGSVRKEERPDYYRQLPA